MHNWANEHNIEWSFHVPYNPLAAQLMGEKNEILKKIKWLTRKYTWARWTKVLNTFE